VRCFSVQIQWASGSTQSWFYPHMVGSSWLVRSLTADQFLGLMQDSISKKTTECPSDLRVFLLEYFFTEEEEAENGGHGIITSVEEL